MSNEPVGPALMLGAIVLGFVIGLPKSRARLISPLIHHSDGHG